MRMLGFRRCRTSSSVLLLLLVLSLHIASIGASTSSLQHDTPLAAVEVTHDDLLVTEANVTASSWNVVDFASLFSTLSIDIIEPKPNSRMMGYDMPIVVQINGSQPDYAYESLLTQVCRIVISDTEDWTKGEHVIHPFTQAQMEVAFPLFYSSGPSTCASDEDQGIDGRLCYTSTMAPGPRRLWAAINCADPSEAVVEDDTSFPSAPMKTIAQASVNFFATHKMEADDDGSPDEVPSLRNLTFLLQAGLSSNESSSSPPALRIDWDLSPVIQAQLYCSDLGMGQVCVEFLEGVLEARHEERYYAWVSKLHDYLLPSMKYTLDSIEGNTYSFPEKTTAMRRILQERPEAQLVCEIGFNAGHGALLWLLSRRSKDTKILAFDIGHHAYTSHAARFIHQYFGGESLELVIGSSVDTVPAYAKAHPETACDILLVDGDHRGKVPLIDCENMMLLANRTSHVVLVDDSDFGPIIEAIQRMTSSRRLVIDEKVVAPAFDTFIQLPNQFKWEGASQLLLDGMIGYIDIGRYIWPEDK